MHLRTPGRPPPAARSARWLGVAAGIVLQALLVTPAAALSVDDARHLLTRTGFGAAPHEIRALLPLRREEAVDRILASLQDTREAAPPPAFLDLPATDFLERVGDYAPPELTGRSEPPAILSEEDDRKLVHLGMREMMQLRSWWLDQMVSTPSPLSERLALMWHGHFTSKYFDVLVPRLMFDQVQAIRREGTRSFSGLLHAMLRDPAMLIFLDNAVSSQRRPNENLARELLELFTLGVGNYGEADVKALARMLAGHSVDFAGDWRYLVRPDEEDTGIKTFLGETGPWRLDDAERIILAQPRTALQVAEKFYREFVSPAPNPAETERLAAILRANGYRFEPLLRAILLSDDFWAPAQRGRLVKSPVELLVGFVRSFGIVSPDGEALASYAELLGQELFEPPTVAGWPYGTEWLATGLDLRQRILARLWDCRGGGIDYAAAGTGDLLLRFAAETAPQAPPGALSVWVNGAEVGHATSRCPATEGSAGQAAPKPGWDVLRVPRSSLPARIETVAVAFRKREGDRPNAFVNWIQVDGVRWPAYLGTQSYASGSACAPGSAPPGMLYCSGRIDFTVTGVARTGAENPAQDALADRLNFPGVNSVIESSARLPLQMRPAGLERPALARTVADRWQAVPRSQWVQAVVPVDLIGSRRRGVSADAESALRTWVLDPTYNLK